MASQKATSIALFSLATPPMRAFHLTWMAFFVCFFAWFACAPLMPVIKGEFNLTKDQIANINIAAVAITILIRLIVGPLCDKYGPRKTYTALLILGSIPVFGVAAANNVTYKQAKALKEDYLFLEEHSYIDYFYLALDKIFKLKMYDNFRKNGWTK